MRTDAGLRFLVEIDAWLQDTRLMNEAVFRLQKSLPASFAFTEEAWPKPRYHGEFSMQPGAVTERLPLLRDTLLKSRFVFLETHWERYLEDLVCEIAREAPAVLDTILEGKQLNLLPDIFKTDSLEELRHHAALRLAEEVTRSSWEGQWKQIARLGIGFSGPPKSEKWWQKLDVYFEIRNCLVHRDGRVSDALRAKDPKRKSDPVRVQPDDLDFFRLQLINCIVEVDKRAGARLDAER
jgi:hypothetical protein